MRRVKMKKILINFARWLYKKAGGKIDLIAYDIAKPNIIVKEFDHPVSVSAVRLYTPEIAKTLGEENIKRELIHDIADQILDEKAYTFGIDSCNNGDYYGYAMVVRVTTPIEKESK